MATAERRSELPEPRARAADGLPFLLGVVTSVQMLATFSLLSLSTLAPKVASTAGVPAQWVGYQVSLFYVAASIVSPMAGGAVRRYGAATASGLALMIGAAGMIGLASGSLTVMALATLALGAGYGLTNPAASHLLFRFSPPARRNLVFAVKQTGVPLGGILVALLLPVLSECTGWRGALALSSVMFLGLLALVIQRRVVWNEDRVPDAPLKGSFTAGIQVVLGLPGLRAIGLMGFFYAGFQMIVISYAVTMLATELGWSLVAAGGVASILQIGGAVGRIFWGWVADRFQNGRQILLLIGLLSLASCLVATTLTPQWPAPAVFLFLAILGFAAVGWNGVFMAEVARLSPPGQVGIATGGILAFSFLGGMIAPASFAFLYKFAGSYAATYGIAAFLPLAGLMTLLLAKQSTAAVADMPPKDA